MRRRRMMNNKHEFIIYVPVENSVIICIMTLLNYLKLHCLSDVSSSLAFCNKAMMKVFVHNMLS